VSYDFHLYLIEREGWYELYDGNIARLHRSIEDLSFDYLHSLIDPYLPSSLLVEWIEGQIKHDKAIIAARAQPGGQSP
jgi:hypothetical protein